MILAMSIFHRRQTIMHNYSIKKKVLDQSHLIKEPFDPKENFSKEIRYDRPVYISDRYKTIFTTNQLGVFERKSFGT